jgi:3-hydroxyisobutyrate dehydrogenase-like beta-hydroxyacid dehydrogenase
VVTSPQTGPVAVVGLGAMGSRMARRLLDSGLDVVAWNRSPGPAARLAEAGAATASSPAEAARGSRAVLTMVAGPSALRAVTEGPDGVLAGLAAGGALIQMATVGVDAVQRLASLMPDGADLVDAPVLGSLTEAEAGTLLVFVGASAEASERWQRLLSGLGEPMRVGPVGAGSAAKLVANATLLGVLALLGEMMALGEGLELSPERVMEVLSAGPLAAQVARRRPVLEGRDVPRRFSMPLAAKDADLVVEAAAGGGLDLPLAEAIRRWFDDAVRRGPADVDYSTILSWIRASAGDDR